MNSAADSKLPVLVVGGSMGALRLAESLRQNGYLGPIKILGDEQYKPYNRPPLSKSFLSGKVQEQEVFFPIANQLNVDWVIGTRAIELNSKERFVVDINGHFHHYRSLVIATGLRPKKVFQQVGYSSSVFSLRTLEDSKALRNALQSRPKVLVIGSGFIGCEVAATATEMGCQVTVLSLSSNPMEKSLGEVFSREMSRRLRSLGITFIVGPKAIQLIHGNYHSDSSLRGVLFEDESFIEADILIQAVGSTPNTEWLDGSRLNLSDGVLTDSAMRAIDVDGAPVEGVQAIGDVARIPYPTFGNQALRVEHWNIPVETARRAGRVLAAHLVNRGESDSVIRERFAPLPSFWTDQFDLNIFGLGLPSLGERAEVLEGQLKDKFVMGYFTGSTLVGVCGLNMKSRVMSYRNKILGIDL